MMVFFLVSLLISIGYLAGQNHMRINEINYISSLSSVPIKTLPIEANVPHVRTVVFPPESTDTNWWVINTEEMIQNGRWHARTSTHDNAPDGREIHWSSGLVWVLAGIAWIMHSFNGLSTVNNVQYAALYAGPIMFVVFIVGLSAIAAYRWNCVIGGLLALALVTLSPLDKLFAAGVADHHGIVTCFCFGSLLTLMAAGAGRVARPRHYIEAKSFPLGKVPAQRWIQASGAFGAAALWVSAATAVPVLIGIGMGALIAAAVTRKLKPNGVSDSAPEQWRTWSQAGAIGSLSFYLLEYAPGPFPFRLEVNHPLYALAWLAAGELLTKTCSLISKGKSAVWSARDTVHVVIAFGGLIAMPVVIKLKGTDSFSLVDPLLWHLHRDYIFEFKSLYFHLVRMNGRGILETVNGWPFLAVPALVILFRRRAPCHDVALIVISLCAALPLFILTFSQIRWNGVAQTLFLGLGIVLLTRMQSCINLRRPRMVVIGCAIYLVGIVPSLALAGHKWAYPTKPSLNNAWILVSRDLAWSLRKNAGRTPITVLSGPSETTYLSFFGDMRGLGTLYWENIEGLKKAAAIYGATTDAEALRLCRQYGVTHLVLFSFSHFAEPYSRLFHSRGLDADVSDCFMPNLVKKESIPRWLRPLPYSIPAYFKVPQEWVRVFEVRPDQSQALALYYNGIFYTSIGKQALALRAFSDSWNLDASSVDTGRELCLSLAQADRNEEALKLANQLPAGSQFKVKTAVGRRMAELREDSSAVKVLRSALASYPNDRSVITDLAWLLSSSTDASVRDGTEALRLMGDLRSHAEGMNFHEVDVLGAAYAANGDFTNAISVILQAVEAARQQGDGNAFNMFQERLSVYRRGEAIRLGLPASRTRPSRPE
jgi:hypothetical protein